MGVLFDYFAAPNDADAAATIDRLGGPAAAGAAITESGRRGLFRRRSKVAETVPEGPAYPTVGDTGIDPVVQAGTLEELLTGRPYEDIEQDPRWGRSLAVRDGGEGMVHTLTDGLVDALAQAEADRLAEVAVPWSQTEEFWGAGDPEELTALLQDLAQLAREARARNESVYCWVSV
ncbi:hypothetical protein D0Z08_25690 [Nocardioides immobilis]|uniref:DUF1877 family protein n=1 Tax=Nocardioides immobilis TaxID=2049295 RepID=A0A417XV12_9ACTN|nr:hypothetical protein [Nocardioides immobilis]RHW24121.1 hypothetical protein D0Z08_25690 [Nocardioides immobilis]